MSSDYSLTDDLSPANLERDPMVEKLRKSTTLGKLGGALVVMGALFCLFKFTPLKNFASLDLIVAWVEMAQDHAWMKGVFYLGYIFAVLALPITLFPIIGGVLFNFWTALFLNMAATVLGASMAFGISRFFGREGVESILKGRLKSFDQLTGKKGFKTVFILRWTGIPPFLVTNYALGLSSVSFKDFLLGTLAGILPWTVLITYMSGSFWQAVLIGGEKGLAVALFHAMGPLMLFSLAIVVIFGVGFLIKKRRQTFSATA